MNEAFFRTRLETALRQLDWNEGIAKSALIEHLAADPPAQKAMGRSLVDGVYFSPADVLNSLPAGAWDEPASAPPPASAGQPPTPATPGDQRALPEPLSQVAPPVLTGAVGTVAVIGFIVGLIWLLRRLRES